MSSSSSRKIILDLATTLDGFIEGKNGETDWCIMDSEMGFTDFLNQIDQCLSKKGFMRSASFQRFIKRKKCGKHVKG